MESTRCGINLTVWWEESQMSKQWCFRVNPPVVKIQTLTLYESVIGSIKLSLVVSSCVPQGEFPLVVRLVLLHWNYGFPSYFSLWGKNPVNFFIDKRYAATPCDLAIRVQALRMYERCIELSPNSKNPSQNRLLALNYLSGILWGDVVWVVLVCWKCRGAKVDVTKLHGFFQTNLGVRKFVDDGGDVQKTVFQQGTFYGGRGHQGFKKIGYHMTKRQVNAWKKHGMIGQRNCLPSGPCGMVFCFVGFMQPERSPWFFLR